MSQCDLRGLRVGRFNLHRVPIESTNPSERLAEERREGFLKRFLSHVALGRFGPACKSFFSIFFLRFLFEYELYTLICLCEDTFILLSFEDNPCSECRTVDLFLYSTFKHLALSEL